MPWGNRTGPVGLGPMTGRAAGYCAGFPVPGFANRGFGFGFWRWGRGGRGRWWGWGAALYPYVPPAYPGAFVGSAERELELLRSQAAQLSQALEVINKRIEELKSKTGQGE